MGKPVKVLIIDDMALIRQILKDGLQRDPDIEVLGTASDPYQARDAIVQLRPDVLTLDVEMPRMDGLEFLRKLMPQYPLPVIMVSALTERGKRITLDCLQAGAVDFVAKPSSDLRSNLPLMIRELAAKVKTAATANVSHWKGRTMKEATPGPPPAKNSQALDESTDRIVAIGASTGGTEALRRVLIPLPHDSPGIVIVQHMPPVFTKLFADRLNQECAINVREARNGDRVIRGLALVAPGELHMELKRSGGIYQVNTRDGDKVKGHRPSVDVLMQSTAIHAGRNALGIILTGMGSDGAEGLKSMRDQGSWTISQDAESCVVFGMPKVAWERGASCEVVPIGEIASKIVQWNHRKTL